MNVATSVGPRGRPGIGLCYQKELHELVEAQAAALDFLEIVPDTAWTDHGRGQVRQYVDDEEMLAFFRAFRREKAIVAHSIGLSIGSGHRFRDEHVAQIARWHAAIGFAWHSDHLAFNLVTDTAGSEYLLGVPFSVTRDRQMLDLLTGRIAEVRRRIDLLFLLENNVNYIGDAAAEFDEPRFLNELCARTNCGLLLDLHNVYVDVCNGLADWDGYLSALDLDNVHEIHLAGGLELNGVYLDAHSGAVPEAVWRIAAEVVPRCRNLRGVTFELLGSWYRKMGSAAVLETFARMRELTGTRQ
jgi:uncharacterized protein (UPF0276 family)